MASINPQIDAAVVLMKARAAEFDETKTMEGVTVLPLAIWAQRNLARVREQAPYIPTGIDERQMAENLIDTMNLCALALSVLPKEGS